MPGTDRTAAPAPASLGERFGLDRPRSSRLFFKPVLTSPRVHRFRVWCAAVLLTCSLATILCAQAAAPEYEVKAAYLLDFGKFVTWPPSAPLAHRNTFTICVLGADPFGSILDGTVRGEKINNKPVTVRRIRSARNGADCNVLFVNENELRLSQKTISSLNKPGTLTVSDAPGFLDRGGMIQFVRSGDRVRFQVNLEAAQEGGLTLSSELLKVAGAVRGKPGGGTR